MGLGVPQGSFDMVRIAGGGIETDIMEVLVVWRGMGVQVLEAEAEGHLALCRWMMPQRVCWGENGGMPREQAGVGPP